MGVSPGQKKVFVITRWPIFRCKKPRAQPIVIEFMKAHWEPYEGKAFLEPISKNPGTYFVTLFVSAFSDLFSHIAWYMPKYEIASF